MVAQNKVDPTKYLIKVRSIEMPKEILSGRNIKVTGGAVYASFHIPIRMNRNVA